MILNRIFKTTILTTKKFKICFYYIQTFQSMLNFSDYTVLEIFVLNKLTIMQTTNYKQKLEVS